MYVRRMREQGTTPPYSYYDSRYYKSVVEDGQAIKGDNLHLGLDVVNKRLIAMNVCT